MSEVLTIEYQISERRADCNNRYALMSELLKSGRRERSAVEYKRRLWSMYQTLDKDVGMQYPFKDVNWLRDKGPITQYLTSASTQKQSMVVTAMKGTLKGVEDPCEQYRPEQMKSGMSPKTHMSSATTGASSCWTQSLILDNRAHHG